VAKTTMQDMMDTIKTKDPKISRLCLNNQFFKSKFVALCFKDLITAKAVGVPLNSLEQLGAIVLADSAGIEIKGEAT
jgi:hypothetical protein